MREKLEIYAISEAVWVNPRSAKVIGPKDEVSFIPMSDVSDSGKWVSRQTRNLAEVRAGYTAFENGDILFAKITPCMENGKGCYVDQLVNGVGYGSTEFYVLRPKPGIDGRFIYHWLQTDMARKNAETFMIGSAGQQRVQRDFFNHFIIPKFSFQEQHRIAEILDTIDEAIQKTEALIEKLKAMKQGLLHDLLIRGLDKNGKLRDPKAHPDQFKDSPLGKIPKEWDVQPLSNLAILDRGKFTHRPRNDPRFYDGKHPFVQTGDIAEVVGGTLETHSQTLNSRGASVSREFLDGTIAITIAANIADTAILGRPMYFPDSIVGAIVLPPNNTRFVELCIRRAKGSLNARAPQSAQKNINLQDLRPLLIPYPKPEEQDRIGLTYDTLAELIGAEKSYCDKLKLQKNGLMQDLLTGRVRVRVQEEETRC